MKKRGLLGLLLACMVMLGASMTVFAADKVIDCNDGFNDVVAKHVDKLVVSGGESFQIILVKGMPTGGGITINGVPDYDDTSSPGDYYTHTIVIKGDSSKKYILSGYSCDDSLGVSVGAYKFTFKEYTEGKPAGQPTQPQPSGQQPQSQSVSQHAEEPGEQLGGG